MKTVKKNGFTMIEILVATVILVIVMALATFLYVKAANMRKLIAYQNDIQTVVNQMFNEIIYGTKNISGSGLIDAVSVDTPTLSLYPITISSTTYWVPPSTYLQFTTSTYPTGMQFLIAPGLYEGIPQPGTGTDTTIWEYMPSSGNWQSLDFNKKITFFSDQTISSFPYSTCFQYFDSRNALLNNPLWVGDTTMPDTPTYVQIMVDAQSTDPALSTRSPIPYRTSIRLKNQPSL